MGSPVRRLLAGHDACQRRRMGEEWRQRKISHLAGLSANSTPDVKDVDRADIMQTTESAYDALIARIWNNEGPEQQDMDPDTDDPFERAALRSQAIINQRVNLPGEAQLAALPD